MHQALALGRAPQSTWHLILLFRASAEGHARVAVPRPPQGASCPSRPPCPPAHTLGYEVHASPVPQSHPARATLCDMHTALIMRVVQPGWMQMLPGCVWVLRDMRGLPRPPWVQGSAQGSPSPCTIWGHPLCPTLSHRNAGSAPSSVSALCPQYWPRAEGKAPSRARWHGKGPLMRCREPGTSHPCQPQENSLMGSSTLKCTEDMDQSYV